MLKYVSLKMSPNIIFTPNGNEESAAIGIKPTTVLSLIPSGSKIFITTIEAVKSTLGFPSSYITVLPILGQRQLQAL